MNESSPILLLFFLVGNPPRNGNQDNELFQIRHKGLRLLTLRRNILPHVIEMILISPRHLRRFRFRHRVLERELQAIYLASSLRREPGEEFRGADFWSEDGFVE